jgi:hypothetical protein
MRHYKNTNDKELINIVITLITDHSVFITNWLELIFNDELKIPPEIKNRIFAIWFCGTIDTVAQEEQNYLKLINECRIRKFENTSALLYEFGNLVESIKKQLREVDENSQLGIIQYRNAIVHGRLHSVHNEKITFRIFDIKNNKTKRTNLNQKEFWKIIGIVWNDGLDKFLEPIRTKFLRIETDYFKNIKTCSKKGFIGLISSVGYKDLK